MQFTVEAVVGQLGSGTQSLVCIGLAGCSWELLFLEQWILLSATARWRFTCRHSTWRGPSTWQCDVTYCHKHPGIPTLCSHVP